MATAAQIKSSIDTNITNKTLPGTIDNTLVGADIKSVVDYVDQEISNLPVELTKTIKTTITSAQILDIFSNPIIIAPSVVGKIIIPTNIVIVINFNTTQYSDVGGSWKIRFGSTSTAISTAINYLGSAIYDQEVIQTLFYSSFTTSSSLINSPILLTTTGNNPIGGDSGIDVYLTYTEITI